MAGTGGMNWMEMLIMAEQLRQQRKANKAADKLANKEPGPVVFEHDPAGEPFNQQQLAWNNQQFDARQTMGRTMAEGFAPYMNNVLKGLGSPQAQQYMTPFGKTLAPLPSPMDGGKGGGFLDYLMKNPQWMDKPAGLPTGASAANPAKKQTFPGGAGGPRNPSGFNRDMDTIEGDTGGWSQDYYDNAYNGGRGMGSSTGAPPAGFNDGIYQGPLGADNKPMLGSSLSPEAAAQYQRWYSGLDDTQKAAEAERAAKLDNFITGLGSKIGGYAWEQIKANPLEFVVALILAPLTGGMSVATFLLEKGVNETIGVGADKIKGFTSGLWGGGSDKPVVDGTTPYTPPQVGPPAPGSIPQ